jgi:uncharacterized protein with GYD domain
MPTFVMLSTLGPDGWATVRDNPERILQVKAEVESLGLRVKEQYALLGQWDFLNVIEADSAEQMARAAVMLAARGTLKTMTLPAIPVDEFVETLRRA